MPIVFPQMFGDERDAPELIETLIWDIWHNSHPRDSSTGSASSSGFTDNEKAKILHSAFSADYQGDAPTRFCEVLRTGYIPWYQPDEHYGRIIATVQSSATGKTRLYYKIGETEIPMFALCFRNMTGDDIDPTQGWPYGDQPVVQYFQPSSAHTSEEMAAAFLGQLYKALSDSAADVGVNCFSSLAPSLDPTARKTFLQKVCSEAKKVLGGRTQGEHDSSTWYRLLFEHYVEPYANKLGSKLQGRTRHPGADFLLVIDECAHLDRLGATKITDGDADPPTFLTGLRRIVKAGDSVDASSKFWLILLDTHYTLYPVSQEHASSARLVDGSYVALPPWISLGIDVNLPSTPPRTPKDALSLGWLKESGRPYWGQLSTTAVLSEAARKLFCGTLDPDNLNHIIAAMSRRIHLPLSNDSINTATHLAAVEKHMRLMTSIGWEDGMVTTAALSEPMLSIAAARTLLMYPKTYSDVLKRFLENVLINEHLVERGRLGETLASVVLIIARDDATCTHASSTDYRSKFVAGTTEEPSIEPVTATTFITSLFPFVPVAFKAFGDHAWINFTHFDILPHILDGEVPVKLLLDAWCRSVAFHCAANQPLYDFLIPIYLGDLNAPFNLAHLSYAVIQVKARAGAAGKVVLESLTGPMIDTGSPSGPHKPPHLAILMDLGTSVSFRGTSSKVVSEKTAAVAPKKTSASVLGHYGSKEPSRWVFHARGLTRHTYPSLPKFGAGLMHKVLYGSTGDEDNDGRDVVRSAATDWSNTAASVLTKG
ncbi:hypothetical protein C8J57DRAFT_1317229, partial [Mycena rebaudengoi]